VRFRPAFLIGVVTMLCAGCVPPAVWVDQGMQSSQQLSGIAVESSPDIAELVDELPAESGAVLPGIPERLLPGGLLEIGDPNAPVSLLLFTNHACAYCRTGHEQIEPRLLADYVRPGKLRMTIAPFPLRKYAESDAAAAALLCAAEQGWGQAMHDLLFVRNGAGIATLESDREAVPVEWVQLRACMTNPATLAVIAQQRSWAHALGITVIPTALINGQRVTGLPEYADLRGEIDAVMNDR
jgi:protein-disulfide isomerase